MHGELKQMVEKNVIEPILDNDPIVQMSKIIRSFMFFKEKFLADGEFDKLKARFTGMEYKKSALYEDVYSPTVSLSSAFSVISIAGKEKRHCIVLDIGGAYLNASIRSKIVVIIDREVTVELIEMYPEFKKFVRKDGTMLVKLKRALYGCVESAKLWHQHISKTLEDFGLEKNPIDKCVFNLIENGENVLTVCVYVDDLLITATSMEKVKKLQEHLIKVYKEVKVQDDMSNLTYLGMSLEFMEDGSVSITQKKYIEDVLRDLPTLHVADTPAAGNLYEVKKNDMQLDSDEKEKFHSKVAQLLYLAKRTRPDVLGAVSYLTTRVANPTKSDQLKLMRVLKYLNGTRTLGIQLSIDDINTLEAYVDASHGIYSDGKGVSALIISLGGGPIATSVNKQKLVSKSSTESELIAISDQLSHIIHVREFLQYQGYKQNAALLYQDNLSTIKMINNGQSSSMRTKHINIRYFFITDRVKTGEVIVKHLGTKQMIADIMTKPLPGPQFKELRRKLLNEKN
jgi:hypothetical protein